MKPGTKTFEQKAIERIFERLSSVYMAAWSRSVGEVPISSVMQTWQNELSHYFSNENGLEIIKWALNNLPERPPNIIEFKKLCLSAPRKSDYLRLDSPKANNELVKRELAKLREISKKVSEKKNGKNTDWAVKILEDKENGIWKPPTVIDFAKAALKIES